LGFTKHNLVADFACYMRIFLLSIISIVSVLPAFSQDVKSIEDKDAAYTKTINTRAEKIVGTLGISDSTKFQLLTRIIANQYRNLNGIYSDRDQQTKAIKEKSQTKEQADAELKKLEDATTEKLNTLHQTYLSALSSELIPEQVIKVKDGMTYSVLPITYQAFLEMIPTLKNAQKEQIMTWLVEAREHAMDAESSEQKHWWFGKYKGKINNYLAAQGYNLREERKYWQQRLTEEEKKKKSLHNQ
jgi:hypothetical protein